MELEIEKLISKTKALIARQESQDKLKILLKFQVFSLVIFNEMVEKFELKHEKLTNHDYMHFEAETAGISYLQIDFDLQNIDQIISSCLSLLKTSWWNAN